MNRDTRTVIVVLVAVMTAAAASYGVYRAIETMPVREVEVAHTYVVAAARPLPTGTRVSAGDLKLVAWPKSAPVDGSFSKVEAVAERGLIAAVQANEPITESKLAPKEAGAGLAPTIPEGMRAISVRVNEVVGVAGFVTPGTRVDVFVTLQQQQPDSMTRVVVSNVQVLAADTRYELDRSKPAEAMPSSVVTLLLAPEDAERVVLASTEGQIMLALRNPLDAKPTVTEGTRRASLFGEMSPPKSPAALVQTAHPAPPKPAAEAAPPPLAPAPRLPYTVETIRAAKRTEETVREIKDTNQ